MTLTHVAARDDSSGDEAVYRTPARRDVDVRPKSTGKRADDEDAVFAMSSSKKDLESSRRSEVKQTWHLTLSLGRGRFVSRCLNDLKRIIKPDRSPLFCRAQASKPASTLSPGKGTKITPFHSSLI